MEQLFGSKTRVKLLKLFTSSPNRSFYVREITRKIEEQINSVRRELANLLSLGIITSDSNGTDNKLYYEVNQKSEYYDALCMLFTGKKPQAKKATESSTKRSKKPATDVSDAPTQKQSPTPASFVDADIWAKVGNISGLMYSGVFTRDSSSPIDIMVVGDVTASRVEAAVAELEKEQHGELRYAVMEVDEWQYRRQVKDKFYVQVMSAKSQVVKDVHGLFTRN
jgi:predicted transcriptional regulator